MPRWIWQHPDWPHFTWQTEALAPLLRQVTLAQGALLGRALGSEPELRAAFTLDALLQNIIDSSAIEGETLNVGSVRSSIARRLGLADSDSAPAEPRAVPLAHCLKRNRRCCSSPTEPPTRPRRSPSTLPRWGRSAAAPMTS